MHTLLHSGPPTLQQTITSPCLHLRLLDTQGQAWVNLVWGHCSFFLSPGAHKVLFVLSKSVSPVLFKFWWPYGGVNGHLLQEGLCHTQVCCTQSLCPCGRPLLTRTSSGDTQTQFYLSLCGISGNLSFRDGHNKGQKWFGPNRSRRYYEEVARIHRRTVQIRS